MTRKRLRKRSSKPIKYLFILLALFSFVVGFFFKDLLNVFVVAEPPVSGEEGSGVDEVDPDGGEGGKQNNNGDNGPDSGGMDSGGDAGEPPGSDRYPPSPGEVLQVADGDYLLALVTKQTFLGRYKPEDLVEIPEQYIFRQYKYELRREALDHLIEMCEAARADGVYLRVSSAYRSYDTQQKLFQDYAAASGEEAANRYSARPGHSEHQLGTTVDFAEPDLEHNTGFDSTASGRWLMENAHRFGFALSYPDGAEEITGYQYEPWHYRYIGVGHARAWKQSGLVLCEFLQLYPQYWLE